MVKMANSLVGYIPSSPAAAGLLLQRLGRRQLPRSPETPYYVRLIICALLYTPYYVRVIIHAFLYTRGFSLTPLGTIQTRGFTKLFKNLPSNFRRWTVIFAINNLRDSHLQTSFLRAPSNPSLTLFRGGGGGRGGGGSGGP